MSDEIVKKEKRWFNNKRIIATIIFAIVIVGLFVFIILNPTPDKKSTFKSGDWSMRAEFEKLQKIHDNTFNTI